MNQDMCMDKGIRFTEKSVHTSRIRLRGSERSSSKVKMKQWNTKMQS
ncbi:MAG: hypothetical protein WBQ25_24965 [Nitrososphaeraceae archaeon]